jgi:DHA1 family bicyclomycin/chloramphenicol resistance-like MFS transporter
VARSAREPRLVLILGSLSAFGPFSIDTCLPALGRDVGVAPAQAQLTLSACLLGLAGGQLIAGPLSDSLGQQRPFCVRCPAP